MPDDSTVDAAVGYTYYRAFNEEWSDSSNLWALTPHRESETHSLAQGLLGSA